MNEPDFRTEVVVYPPAVCLRFDGILSHETALAGAHAIEQVEARAPRGLIIDLRALSFIDSQGLRLVLEAWERARARARGFAVIVPEPPVDRVFTVTGTEDLLPLERSLEGALERLRVPD